MPASTCSEAVSRNDVTRCCECRSVALRAWARQSGGRLKYMKKMRDDEEKKTSREDARSLSKGGVEVVAR